MAHANRTWGEERIAAELLLTLGIGVSPRTVHRTCGGRCPLARVPRRSRGARSSGIMPARRSPATSSSATATFQLVYVFLVLEIGTRRILHWNATAHPTAEWTTQQFRSCLTGEEPSRFVIHDRDAIFSPAVDAVLRSTNLRVLKTPARLPQANAFQERLIGSARRECLDHVIPINEHHLRRVLSEWVCLITIMVAPHESRSRHSSAVRASGATIRRPRPGRRASRHGKTHSRWSSSRVPPRTGRGVSFCGLQATDRRSRPASDRRLNAQPPRGKAAATADSLATK